MAIEDQGSTLPDTLGTLPERVGRFVTPSSVEQRGSAARREIPALFQGGAEAEAEAKMGAFERDQGVLRRTAEAERDVARGTRIAGQELESGLQQRGMFEAPEYRASDYAKNSATRLVSAVLLGGIARTSAMGQLQAIQAMQNAEQQGLMDQFDAARMRFDEQEKQRQDNNKMLKDRFDRMIDLLSKDRNAALVEAKMIEGSLGKGIIAAELRSGNYAKAYDLAMKAIEASDKVALESMKQAGKAAGRAGPGGMLGTPGFTEEIVLHPSGVPMAQIDIYEGMDPKSVADTRRQEFELAKPVRQQLVQAADKARKTKGDMDAAEQALKNIEKKGGQLTGGVYGLPVVGGVLQDIRTSQDPDASRFRTIAAAMQREAYVPGEGQISNFERQLFAQANLDLGRPMQTNYDLIEANKIASERALERANFYDRYFTVNRSLSGADELWTQYLENNPILIRNDKGEIVKNPSRFKSYVDYFRSVEGRSQGGQRSPSRATGPTSPTFANEKDAQAAFDRGDIQQGDEIIVNGVRGNWE
jgi:hypothetical protein